MRLLKFEILSIELSSRKRAYKIIYRAIKNKRWFMRTLWIIAKNEQDAREQAMIQLEGKL